MVKLKPVLCQQLAFTVANAQSKTGSVSLQGIIRAVCAIIDAFHFSVKGEQQPAGSAMSLQPGVARSEEQDTAEAAAHADAVSAHADIQAALTRRVLPTLRGQLVHDGEVGIKPDTPVGLGVSDYIAAVHGAT